MKMGETPATRIGREEGADEGFSMRHVAAWRQNWIELAVVSVVFVTVAVVLTLTVEQVTALETVGIAALGEIALLSVVSRVVRGTSERTRQRYERRLAWLLRSSSDLVIVLDTKGRIVYLNPAGERALGRRPDHLVGGEFSELIHPEEVGAVQALFSDLRTREGALGKSSWRMLHRDGSPRHFEAVAANMLDDPDLRGVVISMRDVTEQRTAIQERGRSLLRDPLTDLANRAMFHERVERAVAARRRDDAHLAVLVIELGGLEAIRARLGQSAGDQTLREIGTRVERLVRFEDIVARIGDDRFGVLLERLRGPEEVSAVAERISAGVREPLVISDSNVESEPAIGIAISDGEDVTPDTLLNDADVALYLSTQNHTPYEMYAHERDPRIGERMVLATELRQAIPRREFVLHFQPMVDLHAGRVAAVEALVRWQHPEHGILEPDEFLTIAEQTGQMGPLSRLILELALEALRGWDAHVGDLNLAINISPLNLRDRNLPDDVARLAERFGISPERLRFEITEGMLFTDPSCAFEVIERLHDLGISFSIDDFGTGYSSLTRLTELPIVELKIDRSFVTAMMQAANKAAIVRSTIHLAQELNLRSVAEGVEDERTLAELGTMGCDVAQGHHIAFPMTAAKCAEWLDTKGRDLSALAVARQEQPSEAVGSSS
jgi:diguanylate cyclase (GGDEF)-like protein/PAS domain S-box-containing protein